MLTHILSGEEMLLNRLTLFVAGTPLYRAPELSHRAAPTEAADMWSMGLTALQVFTGEFILCLLHACYMHIIYSLIVTCILYAHLS